MAYTAAIDIGTTTVAVALLSEEGIRVSEEGFLNPQRKFGSDVISRITLAKSEEKREEMTSLIRSSVLDALKRMLEKEGTDSDKCITKAVVLGNSVMAALFLGLPITKMGVYPFEMPFDKSETIEIDNISFIVPIGVSAFLGADSAAGCFFSGMDDGNVFMDLGTNGEIFVQKAGKIYGASAACGPAFENCTRPISVNANTTLMVISDLLSRRKISRDGILTEEFVKNGIDHPVGNDMFHLTADIFREIQLAVSALYTTYQLLLKEADLSETDISKIYLSGGFAFYVRLFDAMNIGLLPEKLMSKAVIAGNTSLLAAEKIAQNIESVDQYEQFRKRITTINFGGNAEYEELFAKNMILNRRR